jgi:hypothetical protein
MLTQYCRGPRKWQDLIRLARARLHLAGFLPAQRSFIRSGIYGSGVHWLAMHGESWRRLFEHLLFAQHCCRQDRECSGSERHCTLAMGTLCSLFILLYFMWGHCARVKASLLFHLRCAALQNSDGCNRASMAVKLDECQYSLSQAPNW